PDVAHQRNDCVEDLRNPAAEGGGAHMQDALALEVLRALADFLDRLAPGDVGVVREGLLAEWDFLQHARHIRTPSVRETFPSPPASAGGPVPSRPAAVRAARPG